MLKIAAFFLLVSLIAAALGFSGVAGAAAGIVKFLFTFFVMLFLLALLMFGVGVRRIV